MESAEGQITRKNLCHVFQGNFLKSEKNLKNLNKSHKNPKNLRKIMKKKSWKNPKNLEKNLKKSQNSSEKFHEI